VFLLYSLLRIVEKIVIMLTDTDNYLTMLFIYYIFTIEFLSWDDEAKVHQKCTAAHVIICNAASGLVFRKWLCGCGNR
jgi:hypothetical protein